MRLAETKLRVTKACALLEQLPEASWGMCGAFSKTAHISHLNCLVCKLHGGKTRERWCQPKCQVEKLHRGITGQTK